MVALTDDSKEYEPSTEQGVRDDVERYLRTNGAEGSHQSEGRQTVLMTTVGAKSGKLRIGPVMRVEHAGDYAAIASNNGSDTPPGWYFNLKKNPQVRLQDGAEVFECTARETTGDERALWWRRGVEVYPPYADYEKATGREIPVFVLTRVGGPSA